MEFHLTIPATNVIMKIAAGENCTRPFPEIYISSWADLYVDKFYRAMAGVGKDDTDGTLMIRSMDAGREHWFTGVTAKKVIPKANRGEPFAAVSVEQSSFRDTNEMTIDAKLWLPAEVFAGVWKACEVASVSTARSLAFGVSIFDRNDKAERALKCGEQAYFQGNCNLEFAAVEFRKPRRTE